MEIIVAIFLLSILIIVHEFGHFFTARKAGILVEEFGIGLPPKVLSRKKGETIYSINALPFGGFVRLHGESETSNIKFPERAFFNQPAHVRFAVLFSGVAMNYFLGILLFIILFNVGAPTVISEKTESYVKDKHIEIIGVMPNSPAHKAGLGIGSKILKIESENSKLEDGNLKVEVARNFIKENAGKEIKIYILKNGREEVISVIPRVNPPPGEGALGIVMAQVGTLKYPFFKSIFEGFKASASVAGNTFAALYFVLKDLITEGRIAPSIAGPVGIVQIAGEAAKLGVSRFINFIAILTINLAVLNILPIPALDGGRILFLILEKIRGKPISRKVEEIFHMTGMAILIGLIILITIYDIKRLFPQQ
jgi:regulator of sigma E protease